jgi:hypothetical protein
MGIRDIFSRGDKKEETQEQRAPLEAAPDEASTPLNSDIDDASAGDGEQEAPHMVDYEDAPTRVVRSDDDDDSDKPSKLPLEEEVPIEEDEFDEVAHPEPVRNIPPFKNALELLTQTLPARAALAEPRLRANLTGTIGVSLRDSGERVVFDWSGEAFKFHAAWEGPRPDCTISLTGSNLMKIAYGELNPQIGMLSEKIQVTGKAGHAVYFFNLMPRGR